jgi:NNP family nitrate/nitrite transporter-like MFS transporter
MPAIPPCAPRPFRAALPAALLCAGAFFCNFLARIGLAPFLPGLEAEFGVTHAAAGGLFLPMSAAFSLTLALSGFAAKRLGHRRTIVLSTAGLGLGLLAAAAAPSFGLLSLALAGVGAAGGLYFPSGIALITAALHPGHWGRGLAIHELAPNLSFILAPALAAALPWSGSWRAFLAGLGLFTLGMARAAARFRGPDPDPGESPRPAVLREVLADPAFWVLTALFSLIVGASFGPFAMLPLYLHQVRGLPLAEAGALLAGSRLAGPAMVLAAGLLVDRVGARRVATASLAFTGAMTLAIGLADGLALKVAVLLQPALSVLFFPAGFTAAARIFPERIRNVAISLMVPAAVLAGNGLVPLLLGWAGDHGRFGPGFALLGLAVLSGLALLRLAPFPPAHARAAGAC